MNVIAHALRVRSAVILCTLAFAVSGCSAFQAKPGPAAPALPATTPTSPAAGPAVAATLTEPTRTPRRPVQRETRTPVPEQLPSPVPASPTNTAPAPNPAFPLISAPLEAIQVSDDDGRRAARITPQQVEQWIEKANEIFAHASVRFQYDPSSDFATLKSTLLNDMTGDTDKNWQREVDTGNQVAARYRGKIAVFFIHGPEQGPTGGGFSFWNYNFVEMPGFNDTTVCGYQNTGILGHEVGHYLGLSHPFAEEFSSLQGAEAFLSSHGNDPNAFDGDGLSDTPPDPFIRQPQYQCNPKESVTLNGRSLPVPRYNIMSYYSTSGIDRTELTPQQSAIVRWVLAAREKDGMSTPTNLGASGAREFATLAIKSSDHVDCSPQDMSGFADTPMWLGGKHLFCGGQPGGSVEFEVNASTAGMFGVDLYATTAPDFGRIQTLVDGNPVGSPMDLYAPLVLPTGKISLGTVYLTAGSHALQFRVLDKNGASTDYSFGLNAYALTTE